MLVVPNTNMTDGETDYFRRIVDRDALADYLSAELGAHGGTYEVEHHQEGHSNETLFVTWGDEELVIRRPPPGETAENAHDVLGLEEGDFGYPPGFTERQVRRWSEQLTWAFEVTAEEREVETLYDVMSWLQDNVPEDPPATLVHGDYKLDNVMFATDEEPRINAVFDWEMATLGDPFTDLGWMLSYWWDGKDPEPPESTDSLSSTFMTREGYPTRRELVDRYEARTGLEFENERFYRVLAVYKLAGLGEMFFRRYLEGNSDDPMYPKMRHGVPALAQRAQRIIDGEEPL